ncbi:MAG: polyprenyl synthetase family protein [Oligoflexia bacterium]|nr:polyprenyl synthetase family protein [Oligoflexia bacterium]
MVLSIRQQSPYSRDLLLVELERALTQLLHSQDGEPALSAASSYYIFPAGKRIRPLLALLTCADLGGDVQQLMAPAASLELLHAASLIHDDLPSLDNDDFRRGRETCHKKFGEALAVLAGDNLIALASRNIARCEIDPEIRLQLLSASNSAFMQLCAGQVLDLDHKPAEQARVHRLKTGALFGAACEFAALVSRLEAAAVSACRELGQELGILFQIVDDAVDRYGNDQDRGRPGSSDTRNQRLSFFSGQVDGSAALKHSATHVERKIAAVESAVRGCYLRGVRDIRAEILAHAESMKLPL